MLISILKITGIVLLCIIGLAVIITALVLFVPLRYECDAHYHDDLAFRARFTWLLKAIQGTVSSDSEGGLQISVFGRKLEKKSEGDERSTAEAPDKTGDTEKPDNAAKTDKTEKADKVRNFFEIINDESNAGLLERTLSRLKRSVKHIIPKKFSGEAEFGFDDPALTGKVLMGLAFLYPLFGEHVQITPYFDRNVLNGDLEIDGRFALLPVGLPLFLIWLDKDFKRVYNQIKE